MNKNFIQTLIVLISCILLVSPASAQLDIDVETGAVISGYNDVRIPGKGGTLFSLSEDLKTDNDIFYRIRLFYNFNERHHLGVLYAPLSLTASGSLDRALVFNNSTFPANTPLEATYQFNSYRLVYRYDLVRNKNLEFGVGFTAKIRDAKIAVKGNGVEEEKTNVGFVPIIHFRLLWKWSDSIALLLDGDALAAPQGRAEDVLAALHINLSKRIDLKLGYRILEGGADNDEVYNFTLINYAVAGAIFHL